MAKIAVVSLGGAGTSIMREMLGIASDFDAYNVNERRTLKNARYFGYEEMEALAEELSGYDCIIFTAGLGSRSGDALVDLYGMLDGVRRLCFLVTPFYFEIERLMRSRAQLGKIMTEDFEGAVLTLNSLLRDMEEAEPSKSKLEKLVRRFDREVASLIVEMMQEVR
ncbi:MULTISPECIES: hypothetical protein [Archaeoglobus]|jgi:cell division GTPase FtsZ|nr:MULTISPECIES: hypothetical protein [Archaeoglobus]AIG97996.1 hypothetical protein AFULGI_00012170 [Archaeoglobus fulgidus DSM 8774]KUJ94105.1 MAG: hypothetical protein XD40_0699 [Archaeoglobus fulgidus]KUK07695.1 MAG: Uncharacterized protein XD48_0030 [Archaeoglobus fulgidus]MDI3497391.1 hypothetical protein [Archaeoglobus sp.]